MEQNPQHSTTGTTKKPGTSFNVREVQTAEDGTKKYQPRGIVFIREDGRGGVLFFRGPDGKEHQYALFRRTLKVKGATAPEATT